MEINFGATVRLTRAFLPALGRAPAAQLVNVSSIFGIIAPPRADGLCRIEVGGARHACWWAATPRARPSCSACSP